MMPSRHTSAFLPAFLAAALTVAPLHAKDGVHPTAKALIAVLQSHAPTFDKARACQQLTALADKEAVPALAALLGDEKLAGHARSALESIADTSASAALREALGRVQGKLLAGVVNSLGVRRDVEAVPALKKLAADRASGVSAEAMMALGRIASPDAVDALRLALTGDTAESRAAAADASLTCAERLAAQGKRPEAIAMLEQVCKADVPKHVRTAAVYGLIVARQSSDLSLFTAQLQSEDPALLAVALRAARLMSGAELTQALVAGLERLPSARQALVIGALAERKDAAAIAAVKKAAGAGPSELRRVALRALGRVGDASSTPVLISAALSADAGMAEAARESLIVSGAQGVDRAIVARLAQANSKDRIVLLEILGQRGGEASVAAIAKLADDPAREVRLAAIGALGRTIGLENLQLLTSRLQTAKTPEETAVVEQALRAACSRASDPGAYARKLGDCLPEAQLPAQRLLLELMGQIGGREALSIVGSHARDSRPEIQEAATRVLGRWMSVEAAPVLLDLAKTLPDATLRSGCLRGYLRIARQLDLPIDQRLAMCEEAYQVAQRDEERRLAVQVAEIVVKKNAGSAAQRARARAIGADRATSLFDGRTLDGWEGDLKVWRVRDGLIVGGSLQGNPRNEFLATKKSYGNFVLRLEYKLVGTQGFVNSGVQFNSVRLKKPANEMYGFQADIGAGHSGCLYDESRRNKFLARATDAQIKRLEKPGDWNRYEVRCAGAHIQIVLNGEKTVDYIETDPAIPRSGLIGLQMHGGCKAEVSFRNITLEDLSYAAANRWFGIGKSKWKVVSFSSENTKGEDERAELAIDDNPATFWHTQWNGAQPGHPHHLAVDMGKQAEISGFTYLPRQDGRQAAGVIGEYEFYVSRDGKQWGQPVARGRFEDIDSDPSGRVVLLDKPAAGRYFKIVSLSAPGSLPYAGAAEIGVLGLPAAEQWKPRLGLQLYNTYLSRAADDPYAAAHPPAGIQPKRPANYVPYKYPETPQELLEKYGPAMAKKAKAEWADLEKVNAQGAYANTIESLARHQCPEWFKDAKIGMFIDWGPWSVAGYSPDWSEWSMYGDQKPYYDKIWGTNFTDDDMINLLSDRNYNPDYYVKLAKECGFRYVVPFFKMHSGYSLWDSSFTRRNSMDWNLHRDFAVEFSKACKKEGLKFGDYVSIGEWNYPAILPDGQIGAFGMSGQSVKMVAPDQASAQGEQWGYGGVMRYMTNLDQCHHLSGKIPVKNYVRDYMIPSIKELIDKTKPDLIWFDGEWGNTMDFWHTVDLDAYYYNQALRDKHEVCINDRSGDDSRKKKSPKIHVDYSTVERGGGDVRQCDWWEACDTFSGNFGYDWTEESNPNAFLSDKACIDFFVDIVGRGGNLLLMVSPTGTGEIPPRQMHSLRNLGDWLRKYGQAIYDTRSYRLKEQPKWGRITHSKDGNTVYLLVTQWPADGRINVPAIPIQSIVSATIMHGEGNPGFCQPDKNGAFMVDVSACAPGDPRLSVVAVKTTKRVK